jgi:hypothetical protein
MCAASAQDLITDTRNAGRPISTTVATARASGATTLACTALTYWPTASKVHFVTYQIDSNSNPVSGTQLDCEGIVVGNSITSLVVNDGTDNGNSVGDIVEMLPTANWGQDLSDALNAEHSRIGKHTAITANSIVTTGNATVGGNASVTGTLGVTSTSTFTGVATFTAAPSLPAQSVGNTSLKTTAGDMGGAWEAWYPTCVSSTGTITSYTSSGKYTRIGKTIIAYGQIVITNNGSGSGYININVPAGQKANCIMAGYGRGNTISGKTVTCYFSGSATVTVRNYDSTYPVATDEVLDFNLQYEMA